jgi:endonuclease/exonuclease/phosphatase family metal-dependent hydrolase
MTRRTFLTWNLAMLERSDEAPASWGLEQTEQAVCERVLAAAPDIVVFQELPGLVPYRETHAMVRANPRTHQGHLATLVGHEAMANEGVAGPTVTVVAGCALLVTFADGLTVANVHLAPGPAATGERLEQFARIVEASPTPTLLIVGDTNTRVAEEGPLADAGLVGTRPRHPTWDSKRNRYRAEGARFTAHFSRWFASPGVSVDHVTVDRRPVTADGHRFHLSDHHPLRGTVSVDD